MPITCNRNLKTLRMTAGVSQNRLARISDLDRMTISRAENGNEIQELSAQKIANGLESALGRRVDISEFS